jgi:hypothetical protein
MAITRYKVYGTFDDLIKLYRRALKKGYSYGEIEPVLAISQYNAAKAASDPVNEITFSWKYNLRKQKVNTILLNGHSVNFARRGVPRVLLYRNYADRTVNQPDFELFKLTLTKE